MNRRPMRTALAALLVSTAWAGTTALAADVTISADITTSTTWTADNEYFLNGVIFVTNGATLTIEPGTVIRGLPDSATPGTNDPGTLVIARGSKIQALGTRDMPVVFTDENDDNVGASTGTFPYDTKEDALGVVENWGGLILLGYGYVATSTAGGPNPATTQAIEGLESAGALGDYGDCAQLRLDLGDPDFVCDDDDSGTMRYVTISYGGFNLSANNEINGLTLGGVGRETDIDYLEIFQNKDDGIEFFGGAAGLKHAVIANCGDDGLDYDEGWRGNVQFLFQLQGIPGVTTDKSDKGGEHDGGTGVDASQPFAIPTIYNATYVGHGQKSTVTQKDRNTALHIRDNAGGRYYNSAFLDFSGASVLIEGSSSSGTGAGTSGERSITSYESIVDGEIYLDPDPETSFQLELEDNTFWCIGRQDNADVIALGRQGTLPTRGRCSTAGGAPDPAGALCLLDTECGAAPRRCVDSPLRWHGDSGKVQHDNGLYSNASNDNQYLSCGSALPIRALTRTDLAFDPTIPNQATTVDPLPATGSPLLTTNRNAPAGGFFEPAPYRGAFGTTNWARGWTKLSRLGYFPSKNQVTISGNVTTSQTWTAENEYILDGVIFVTNGATLTIEKGTVIRGLPDFLTPGTNDPGALVVARGSKIDAQGTAEWPIVFTDLDDSSVFCPVPGPGETGSCGAPQFPYDTQEDALGVVENWGGVILLGYGYVATSTAGGPNPATTQAIEGLESAGALGDYGDCAQLRLDLGDPDFVCDDDDSGRLRYVTIAHGGFNLSANNEINGLTLGGVGRGTEIEYLEIFQNKDDGIEFFGGAAGLKHAVVANCGDDGLDYDEGWRGNVQFLFQLQGIPGIGIDRSDKGGEHDGGTGVDASQPFAIPTIYNATYIGHGQKSTVSFKTQNTVLHMRDNAGGRYYNSAFLDFSGASVLIEGSSTSGTGAGTSGERAITSYEALVDGEIYLDPDPETSFQLELEDNTFWCIGRQENADVIALGRQGTLPTRGRCSTAGGAPDPAGALCLFDTECGAAPRRCVDTPLTWHGDSGKVQYDNGLFSNASNDNQYLSCGSSLPIRALTRTDLAFDPTIPNQATTVNPLPATGSPLLTTDRNAPGGGLFEPAPYRGAFGTTNWTYGWSKLARNGYVPSCEPGVTDVEPGEVAELSFGASKTGLVWTPVQPIPGSGIVYDVLSSATADDFTLATFVETDDADTKATVSATPAAGDALYLLVRAGNRCGDGSLGQASDGSVRAAP